eukprot:TRINITY_DN74476_c0_g1_i1.p1 TRINITY_DN74476_c0_g1~~TRINITY_DN74476_c0_g1_i1.p1  ORF type:complete len:215 (+),score=28.00 TRINITY_DN74476_c0_g1_i1:88-645(+)
MYADSWHAVTTGEMYGEQCNFNANPYNWPCYSPVAESLLVNTDDIPKKPRKGRPYVNIFAKGTFCEIRKHDRLGCAIANFESADLQAAVLRFVDVRLPGERATWTIGAHEVTLKHHFDDQTNEFDSTGMFIFWGHKAEKLAPLHVKALAEQVDLLVQEVKASLEMGLQAPRADQLPSSRFLTAKS